DGTTQNVTATAAWQSSNTGLASVSSSGLVTAAGAGSVTITATYQGKSATLTIVLSFSSSTRSTMTAGVAGAALNSVVVSVVRTQVPSIPSGILGIGGTSGFTGTYQVLAIAVPAAVGTYQLGPNAIPNGSLHQNSASSSIVWDTLVAGGSGTITLNTVTATSA